MSPEQQLAYERRVRSRQAAIAFAAGVLLITASAIQLSGPHTKVDELTVDLIVANKRFPIDLIAAVVNGLGSLAVAWTLNYLYQCSRARNPEVRPYVRWIAIAGGVLAAVTGIVYAVLVAVKVHEFVTTGAQTYDEANRLTNSFTLLALQLLGQGAALLLAVGFALVSLTALRQGLLTRFVGYLGIFAGVLVLFQVTQIPIVQGYWLAAVAYLFSGRWPTGVPPAWLTGRAEPWASSAEIRARRGSGGGSGGGGWLGRRGGSRGGGGLLGGGLLGGGGLRGAKPPPAPEPQPAGPSVPARTRAGTPKRKRKRRS